jgi:hypothetical protein
MFARQTKERFSCDARKVQALKGFVPKTMADVYALDALGIGLDEEIVREMAASKFLNKIARACAQDAIQPTVTVPSIATPIQFLQYWLPGFTFVVTAPRMIDEFIGISMGGQWHDEQIVQGILERVGQAVPYGDLTNIPYSSWNTNFVTRTVVRFEEGMQVGRLETARSAQMRVDNAGMKREAAALELDIIRNQVGFFGFNNGDNQTYGFLNDPGEPNYVEVAVGASTSTLWSTKTFLEIVKDIRTAVVALRTNSQGLINPEKLQLTLAVAVAAVDQLSTVTDFGISVTEWLKKAYPNIRVTSAPQLNGANASLNVFYLFAEKLSDMSTDDGRIFIQSVQTKFQVTGVEQLAKSYKEDYTNAMAGVMCKRPYGVVRYYGI